MERALASSRDLPVSPVNKRRIRLMIVDDSVVARAVLSRMVESDDAFELAAVAGTAEAPTRSSPFVSIRSCSISKCPARRSRSFADPR